MRRKLAQACGSGADGAPARPGRGRAAALAGQDLLRRQVAQDVIAHGKRPGAVPFGLLRAGPRRSCTPRSTGAPCSRPRLRAGPWRRSPGASRLLPAAVAALLGDRPGRAFCDPAAAGAAGGRGLRHRSMTDDLLAMVLAEVEACSGRSAWPGRCRCWPATPPQSAPAQRVSSAPPGATGRRRRDRYGRGIAAAAALRPRPGVTVVLTDGYTPWPRPVRQGMRVVIALLGEQAPEAPSAGPGGACRT